jgi:hypothetical protein
MKHNPVDRRIVWENLIFSVPLLMIGVFVFFRCEKGDLLFWVASAVFIAGAIGFYIWKRHRPGLFRCPSCGGAISEIIVDPKGTEPSKYRCGRCDVEWERDYLCFPKEDDL